MITKNKYFKTLFFNYLMGCQYAKKTINRSRVSLKLFFKWLNGRDIREIQENDIVTYIKYLNNRNNARGKPYSKSSLETYLSTVKMFFQYLYKNEYILADVMSNMRMPKSRKKLWAIFSREEINDFLDCIGVDDEESQRDKALFELMYSSGLRVMGNLFLSLP